MTKFLKKLEFLKRFEIEYMPCFWLGIGYEKEDTLLVIFLPFCMIGVHCERKFNSKL